MKLKFDVYEPMFRSSCIFLVGWTIEKVKKLFMANSQEKIDWEDLYGSNGFCILAKLNNGNVGHLVWLKDFDMTTESVSTLSHELNHLAFDVLNHKGVPIRHENQEVFAYLQQFYLTSTLKVLQKNINKCNARAKESIRHKQVKKGRNNTKRR